MDSGLQKTIVFLCFILIGVLLKAKFTSKDELNGIKKIILNLALPATIFIALLGIKIEWNLLFLPVMALGLNLFLFLLAPLLLPLVGIAKNSPEHKTARLLIPSLAPGLSCFPFVLEFLGDTALAKVAMADLGNKVFVLIFLYLVAMNWHFQNSTFTKRKGNHNLISLLKVLISEPVNLFIGAALLLLAFGITMDSLPLFLNNVLHKLSLIMTPLVLLFIGLGLKIRRKQFFQVFSLLTLRAGAVVLLCALVVSLTGLTVSGEILLLLAFALSSCSFWPYAHISSVESLEIDNQSAKRTFNSDFALTVLALSFPLSTILILGVLNTGTLFVSVYNVLGFGSALVGLGLIYPITTTFQKRVLHKISGPDMKSAATKHI
ncbi:permease [Flagellimonas allohymeniacidonis]|uniref:Permease n=1 Tax=Flagellimonas allohymeniacidonis TaxID=2517819 RepID=A0A4Q8QEV4_9FLAO|nr:permease [Allomuricauda hymeniacidonis]TAI47718.1 permease [Allomuricauda hymeniacidonis]